MGLTVPLEAARLIYCSAPQGLWWYLCRTVARKLRQVAAAGRPRSHTRPRSQGSAWYCVETEPNRTERRTTVRISSEAKLKTNPQLIVSVLLFSSFRSTRSLIALSLIMALLQFKPAPMYILDEIDAALDLSHTQHIGQLFRTRFKGSQFIVVSLKEGLFTNANVLFRARFRDGTSIVERTAQRSMSALYTNGDREDEDNSSRNPGRGRRAG